MLWLQDAERPTTMAATLREAADRFHVNLDTVLGANRWRHERPRLSDAEIEALYYSAQHYVRLKDHYLA